MAALRPAPSRLAGRTASGAVAAAVVAAALGVFALVADQVADGDGLARLDGRAHAAFVGALGAGSRDAAWAVTWFGNNATVTAFVVLVVVALLAARQWTLALRVAFASGVGGLVVVGLKTLFARARPVEQLVAATGFSFPSGHAWAATVFYGMMVYLAWRLTTNPALRALAAVAGVALVVAVGLSRVVLNVHFLTDVVAGWAAGTAWLVGVLALAHVLESRWARRRRGSTSA